MLTLYFWLWLSSLTMEVFWRYLRYVQLYFRFIIDDMLHSQCKLISNWSRYVHSFNVCTLKYSVFTFGYGILGWRWKCSSPYLKYTYFYTFPLFFDDILYSQWQGMYTRSCIYTQIFTFYFWLWYSTLMMGVVVMLFNLRAHTFSLYFL